MTRQPDSAAPGAAHPLFRIQPLFHIRQRARRPGERIDPHHHDEAQLILALSGTTQIHTDTGRWLVPPQLAVWIPAGITHRLDVLSGAEMRLLHWHPDALRRWAPALPLDREFALRVSPLLRELTQAAFAPDTDADKQLLIGQLILHELNAVVDALSHLGVTEMRMPASPLHVWEAIQAARGGDGEGLTAATATDTAGADRDAPSDTLQADQGGAS